jgi:Na+/melibiose symporter-like transporter
VPDAIQSAGFLPGIRLIVSVLAGLVFIRGVACLFLYRIETNNIQMTREWAERRREYAS